MRRTGGWAYDEGSQIVADFGASQEIARTTDRTSTWWLWCVVEEVAGNENFLKHAWAR